MARPPSVNDIAQKIQNLISNEEGRLTSAAVVLSRAKKIQKTWSPQLSLRDFFDIPGPKQSVINGTGVILHTNLGRAPLGEAALQKVLGHLSGYIDLELDLRKGQRGGRTDYLDALFESMVRHYRPVWVNNNAAAVLLALNTLKKRTGITRLVISRGELVEIGGGFRVPDIMSESGFDMVEVGTTNKTRLTDYERALKTGPAVVCAVHPSNFTMHGFTESVAPKDLIPLCRKYHAPLIYDAGTLNGDELRKLPQGYTCVTVSTDKTLGSTQGGVIIAKKEFQKEILKNPLYRAMRLDKVSLALLEVALEAHADKRDRGVLPFSNLLHRRPEEVKRFAESFLDLNSGLKTFSVEVAPCEASIGGGSLPGQAIPTFGLALNTPGKRAVERLRTGRPPVIATIVRGRPVVNLHTVFESQGEALKLALSRLDDRCGADGPDKS